MNNIVYINDYETFKKISAKYNKLIKNKLYCEFLENYIDTKVKCSIDTVKLYLSHNNIQQNILESFNILHSLKYIINHLYYIENNEYIYIFFYNILIGTNKKGDTISSDTIEKLFLNIKIKIAEHRTLIPLHFILYILELSPEIIILINSQINIHRNNNNNNANDIHTKRPVRIDFKICKGTIIFYIKYNEIMRCNISNIKKNTIIKLFKLYNTHFKKKKVAVILKSKYFWYPSSLNLLQKYFFENGYWTDILTSREGEISLDDIKYYNNIIITHPNHYNVNLYNNKKIIILPIAYGHDHSNYINRNENIILHKKKAGSNKVIIGFRPLDKIESVISTGYIDNFITSAMNIKNSYFNCNLTREEIGVLNPDNTINNKGFLDKQTFFKIYNLDIKKKTITIFLVWPVIDSDAILDKKIICGEKDNHKIFRPQFLNFEYQLYYKNSLLLHIISILQKKYNVLIKLHPNNCKMIDNKLYVNVASNIHPKNKLNESLNNIKNDKEWGICNLLELHNNKIVDYDYHEETLTYTDAGIIFYPSTVSWYNWIYKFPMLHISTNNEKDDWFKWLNMSSLNKKGEIKKEKQYRDLSKIKYDKKKLFNLKDINYGEYIYIEDIRNNLEENLFNIILKMMSSEYKYKDTNPLFKNQNTKDIVLKLIEIIQTKYK
tara:strand:+ start:4173 stop:6161 length:1989 start_codon:yes stop_codon:yes gene_type:complete